MGRTRWAIPAGYLLASGLLTLATPTASAQMGIGGAGRSLGGYGGATIGQYYGGGTTTYMPYNGGAGGWVPYRGGYAGGFSFGPVARRPPRTPIGGLSMPMTPIGGASRRGGMIEAPSTGQVGRRSPLGPGFRYPFATPPSLAGPSGGMGPSM